MPEGHSVHRISRQFARNFVGHDVTVTSPQGRFAEGATLIDGQRMTDSRAVGKQMFLQFENGLWLRVHLGIYGAWDFAGEITTDATIRSAGGRMGQTNQTGTVAGDQLVADSLVAIDDLAGEDSVSSIGAPRRTRLHMAERESLRETSDPAQLMFPPEPIGQVRVRLLTDTAVADLRGPTACEVLDEAQVDAVIARLGPDPLLDSGEEAAQRFVTRVRQKSTAIGILLMDQSVVAGIGNVYRAELLFRARLNPHAPGKSLSEQIVRRLWQDWAYLLDIGVRTGQMMTMDDLDADAWKQAMASRADRHWVYKREGLPCRICGTNIVLEEMQARKLYWCPNCQR